MMMGVNIGGYVLENGLLYICALWLIQHVNLLLSEIINLLIVLKKKRRGRGDFKKILIKKD